MAAGVRPPAMSPVRRRAAALAVSHAALAGNGVRWQARCADGSRGRAAAASSDVTRAAPTPRAAGSATTGRVDPRTGVYTGTARTSSPACGPRAA